jgi:hypothetical protein
MIFCIESTVDEAVKDYLFEVTIKVDNLKDFKNVEELLYKTRNLILDEYETQTKVIKEA